MILDADPCTARKGLRPNSLTRIHDTSQIYAALYFPITSIIPPPAPEG